MENEHNVQDSSPEAESTGTENTAGQTAGAASAQEKTFTQAEVDALIRDRLGRERSKYPTKDELDAYRAWKISQPSEKERWDDLNGRLASAEAERDQLKRELYIVRKGITGEEAEFIAFKAGKMVDGKTTFEQAVDALAAERKRTTFDWTAPVGDGQKTQSNEMNALIRGAFQ